VSIFNVEYKHKSEVFLALYTGLSDRSEAGRLAKELRLHLIEKGTPFRYVRITEGLPFGMEVGRVKRNGALHWHRFPVTLEALNKLQPTSHGAGVSDA